MRKLVKHSALVGLFLLLFISTSVKAQYRIIRGERPPINYNELNDSIWEKGVLLIKFSMAEEKNLENKGVGFDKNGIVTFHIQSVDSLNQIHQVKSAHQHFATGAFKNGFTERHKAWGFNLWYRLELDEKADIPLLIEQFGGLKEIEVAEPEFKKILIGSHNDADFIPFTPGKSEKSSSRDDVSWFPNDEHFAPYQWHYHNTGQADGTPGADISLPGAWAIETGVSSIIVAVIDEGINFFHPDLVGSNWEGYGYNFVDDTLLILPGNHGTHVGGTVGAVTNNEIGVAGVAGGSGTADGVRLMSLQVFDPGGTAGGHHIAPIFAADNGASISQNSWGYWQAGYYEHSVLDAIDYFNVNGGGEALEGGITIFSAGNWSSSGPFYPGYYSGAFSVAATTNEDKMAYYSVYDNWIDISAPGGETNVTGPKGILSTILPTGDQGHIYGFYMGTSMASPHVSGAAALMLSQGYDYLTPELVKDILRYSADNIYGVNPAYIGMLGSGRLNAQKALEYAEIVPALPESPENFTATDVGDKFIELSWMLNNSEDPVILAYSVFGIFGKPESGIAYQPGDIIEGGGEVLYIGNATTFIHDSLQPATHYLYQLWSVNENNYYSLGRNFQTNTFCSTIELPYIQPFNVTDLPNCWTTDPFQGNWEIIADQGNPAPSVIFKNLPVLIDYSISFVTPIFNGDIPGSQITLEFDVFLYRGAPPYETVEYLTVQVQDGDNWVDVIEFDNTVSSFPWTTYAVDITEHVLGQEFSVRFTANGENSWSISNWNIDNVMIYASSCNSPENITAIDITANSVLILWDDDTDVDLWNIKYGQKGFNPYWSGTEVNNLEVSSCHIEGLNPWTDYDVYVQSHCGDGDLSLWIGPVSFKTLPTCPEPNNLQVSYLTGDSALISWESAGVEEEWIVNWGLTGFNPNNAGNLVSGITETQYLLNDLESNTVYDVYVRAYCSSDDISFWQGPLTFDTPCSTIELPYLQDFGDDTRLCWSFPEGQGNWKFANNFAPPSSVSGPPHAVFTWNPVITNYSHSLTSPILYAPDAIGQVAMDFILFFNSHSHATIERISVEYKALDASSWTLIQSYSNAGMGSTNVEYIVEELLIPDVAGDYFQIRFRAHGSNSFNVNGRSIDDLVIYQIIEENCIEPSDAYADFITINSAEISWTPGGDESEWEILWGHTGFDPQSAGNHVTSIDVIPFLLENLEHSSFYDVYVRAVCNNGLLSEWVGPVTFTTETPWYDVTVSINPEEGGTVSGYGTFMHGEEVALSAIPEENFIFVNWEEDGQEVSDESQFSFIINAHRDLTANFHSTVNIDEMWQDGVSIYPIPASDIVNFVSSETIRDIYLYNLTGQKVLSIAVINNNYKLDVTALPQGFYITKLKNMDGEVYTTRILIAR